MEGLGIGQLGLWGAGFGVTDDRGIGATTPRFRTVRRRR